MSRNVTRLYTQFQPEHYDLRLTPDAENMSFSGSVTIRGKKSGRPSKRLTFHQKDLTIRRVNVSKQDKHGDKPIAIERVNKQKSYDEVRLHSDSLLYPGNYTVVIEFSGKITRPMNGLYPSFYTEKGKSKKLLATQFESHHAREVFPCIDEPEAKAAFNLQLVTPAGQTVLSNTPVSKQIIKGALCTTKFATTPVMSVYLLAFVVGDLKYKEATTKQGVVVRTYAIPENVKHTTDALDIAVKCLEFYNEYFGIDYPLPKCDLIALPDFAAGAMENWGCITFREGVLLIDPANTSLSVRQYVAMVIAHELAHQWFGNLVTMRWWTDLWLNEGFASWVEYLAVDHLFPKWEMWTQFVTDEQQTAMRLDALANTHAVEVPVNHPDEIRSIFDTISYSKGASVIHMLHQYLGAGDFRDGLRHYLKQHAYGNTDTVDLWQALADISKKPVDSFMHAWTSQSGYPLLQTSVEDGQLQVSQQRFLTNPKPEREQDQTLWPIPVNAGLTPDIFDRRKHSWSITKTAKPIKLNRLQGGFYRTIYNHEHLKRLGRSVADGTFGPLDRLGILSDVFESAKAGYCSATDALTLLEYYRDEDNSAVWDVIASGLNSLRSVMDDEQLRQDLKPYVRRLTAKQLKRLGWKPLPKESHFDSLLRPTILGLAAVAEEPAVVKECLSRFKNMKRPEDLPVDLRGVIYNTAARHGNQATFDKLLSLHNNPATLSEERNTLTAALTGFEQPNIIAQALALIDTDTVRLQDVGYWIAFSFMNRHAKRQAWQWLTKHWDWLVQNLGADLSFPRLPIYSARSFSEPAFLPKYVTFFSSVLTPSLERSYKQGLEMIEWQSAWKQRDLTDIRAFIKASNNSSLQNPGR